MWAQVKNPANAIAVIHVPPLGTALDLAPELGPDLNLKMSAGGPRMTHVGSSAVRAWIEETQPLCGLHGHVHESKAAENLGRTLCLNPGSEYSNGVLLGALVALGDGRVMSHQFVSG
jgi:Icc-related predicted phosphoesterase